MVSLDPRIDDELDPASPEVDFSNHAFPRLASLISFLAQSLPHGTHVLPAGMLNVRNDLQQLHKECGDAMKKTIHRHYTAFVRLAEKVCLSS